MIIKKCTVFEYHSVLFFKEINYNLYFGNGISILILRQIRVIIKLNYIRNYERNGVNNSSKHKDQIRQRDVRIKVLEEALEKNKENQQGWI